MFKLLRIARFGSQAHKPASSDHGHDSHNDHSHKDHSHDHHHSDAHGHVSHHKPHKKIPEGSWHRHSDDEDPYYYYDRYGPFHNYSLLGYPAPEHGQETPDDDIYKNTIQGYIRIAEVNDHRKHSHRALHEFFFLAMMFFTGVAVLTNRNGYDGPAIDKKLGDALITAQEIDLFIERARERLAK